MLDTAEGMRGLEIYTPDGIFVGVVSEIIVDLEDMRADSLFVADANPVLVDGDVSVAIPMRWVASVGDVILLNTFPKRVTAAGVTG